VRSKTVDRHLHLAHVTENWSSIPWAVWIIFPAVY